MNSQKSLFDLIKENKDGYVVFTDIDDDLNRTNCRMVGIAEVPDEYLPDSDSFYLP